MKVAYTVTWLEMDARSPQPRRAPPVDGLTIMRAVDPPVHFFRYLYDTVGGEHEWTDLHAWPDDRVAAFVQNDAVHLNVAYLHGKPIGLAMLDFREMPVADIANFGLIPEFIAMRLGSWLLMEGIHDAWDAGIEKLTVNTCTLDHPAALPLYIKMGFVPVRHEEREREVAGGS